MALNRYTSLRSYGGLAPERQSKPVPKKNPVESGVEHFPCGREKCDGSTAGRREYKRRLAEMVRRQRNTCATCRKRFDDRSDLLRAEFDHQDNRGLGGCDTDDRILIAGDWYNAAVHAVCNQEMGSVRYAWRAGRYLPVLKEAA